MITKCPHGIYIATTICTQCFTNADDWQAFKTRASAAFWNALAPPPAGELSDSELGDALRASLDVYDLAHNEDRPTLPS